MKKVFQRTKLSISIAACLANGVFAQSTMPVMTVVGSQGDPYYSDNSNAATRTDTPLQQTPQSVVVINKQLIEDQGSQDINSVLRNVSNINYVDQRETVVTGFKIRGFNSGYVVDGVAMPGFFQGLEPVTNIEQLAVIKGPGGGLYDSQAGAGAATLGGTIVINTLEPTQQEIKTVGFGGGSFGQKTTNFDINKPINDVLAVRVNGEYSDSNSEVNSLFFKNTSLFPSISLTPSNDTKVVLRLRYVDYSTLDYSGLPRDSQSSGVAATGLARSTFIGAQGQPDTTNKSSGANLQLTQKLNEVWKFNLTLAHNTTTLDENGVFPIIVSTIGGVSYFAFGTPGATGQNLAGLRLWQKFTSDNVTPNLTAKFNTENTTHLVNTGIDYEKSQNDGYMSNATGSSLSNLATLGLPGVYNNGGDGSAALYNLPANPNPQWGTASAPPAGDPNWQHNPSNTTSIFVQDQMSMDKFHILASIRHSKYDVINNYLANNNNIDSSISKNTYKLGASFDITSKVAPFIGFSDTARVPVDVFGLTNPKLEEGKQAEAGLKLKDVSGLTATIAYFDLKRMNVATYDLNYSPYQVGAQESKGVDMDLNWKINSSWQWLAAYTNQSAKVISDVINPGNVGMQLFNVPEKSARLATRYDIKSGNFEGLGFGIGTTYASQLPGDSPNDFFTQAVTLWDAQVSYKVKDARFGLNINNLANTQYYRPAAYFNGGQVMPGLPRTILATAKFSF
jgi:iron complex outermembrane recepter protein